MNDQCELISAIPTIYVEGDTIIARRPHDGGLIRISPKEAQILKTLTRAGTLHGLAINIQRERLLAIINKCTNRRIARTLIPNSLQERARHYILNGGLDDREPIREISTLTHLLNNGLIQHKSDFFKSLLDGGQNYSPTLIQTKALLTCERPAQFRKALELLSVFNCSYSNNLTSDLLIVDDSRLQTSEHAIKSIVSETLTKTLQSWAYVGIRERLNLGKLLSSFSKLPTAVVEFALIQRSPLTSVGSARNVISLLTAGQRVLEFDDDITSVASDHKSTPPGLDITSDPFPYDIQFASQISADHHNIQKNDPSLAHSLVLGRNVKDLCMEQSVLRRWPSIGNGEIDADDLHNGRVRVTTMGSVGDPGTQSMTGFLLSASKENLRTICSGNSEKYELAIRTRSIHRSVQFLTLTRGSYLQAMSIGIDNSRLVPPFFPFGRNEDGLFAKLFLYLERNSWIGHIPGVVGHFPETCRKDDISYCKALNRLRLNDIITLCVEDGKPTISYCLADGLTNLGLHLENIGKLEHRIARKYFGSLVMKNKQRLLSQIARRRSECGDLGKQFIWDLDLLASEVRSSMADVAMSDPVDLQRFGSAHSFELMMSAIASYGMLLKHWAELWDASKTLRESGKFDRWLPTHSDRAHH